MSKQILAEARHFDSRDMADRRKVSWSRLAAPYVKRAIYGDRSRNDFLSEIGLPNTPGLTLACGDMKAEAPYFKLLDSSTIDAFDVSKESLNRAKAHCKSLGLNVNISVADVNNLNLPKNHYGLVVIVHSFHHFDKIEQIAEQIAESMLPNGIFLLLDYVGPRYLQFTPQQLKYANKYFKDLPVALRVERSGEVQNEIHPPLRWGLSINEAIQSPKILPAIESNFSCLNGLLFGGLMHPTLERVSGAFNPENPKHTVILDKLWAADRQLIDDCEIEPNFCELVLVRKDSQLLKKYPAKWFKYRPLEIDGRYEWLTETCSKEIWRLKEKIEELRATIKKRDQAIYYLQSPVNFLKKGGRYLKRRTKNLIHPRKTWRALKQKK